MENENKEIKNEIVKVIGRISKKGNEYYQTAINVEGEQENKFIPVFLKKGVEKLNFTSMERKIDKRGVVILYMKFPHVTFSFLRKRTEKSQRQ